MQYKYLYPEQFLKHAKIYILLNPISQSFQVEADEGFILKKKDYPDDMGVLVVRTSYDINDFDYVVVEKEAETNA